MRRKEGYNGQQKHVSQVSETSRGGRRGKSLIFGLLVGFAANIVIATVSCFVKVEGLWLISIGLLLVGTLISAPIFYFAKFRPTTKQIAARVDRQFGVIEERTITMLELENDDSYIAMASARGRKRRSRRDQ